LAQSFADTLRNFIAVGKHRSLGNIGVMEQEPKLKAGIADGNLESNLPCRLECRQSPRQVPFKEMMVRIEKHPKLIPRLYLCSLLYVFECLLQTIYHVDRRRKSGTCRGGQDHNPDPWQWQMLEIILRGISIIAGDNENTVIPQSSLGASDGQRITI